MKEVLTRLDALAAKLNTTGGHLWQVLVRQAQVEAVKDLLTALLCTVAAYLVIRLILRMYKADPGADQFHTVGVTMLGTMAVILLTVVGVVSLLHVPTELLNPEYWALHTVLNALSGK